MIHLLSKDSKMSSHLFYVYYCICWRASEVSETLFRSVQLGIVVSLLPFDL